MTTATTPPVLPECPPVLPYPVPPPLPPVEEPSQPDPNGSPCTFCHTGGRPVKPGGIQIVQFTDSQLQLLLHPAPIPQVITCDQWFAVNCVLYAGKLIQGIDPRNGAVIWEYVRTSEGVCYQEGYQFVNPALIPSIQGCTPTPCVNGKIIQVACPEGCGCCGGQN